MRICFALLLLVCSTSPVRAQTFTFTDDPLVPAVTPVKAVHVAELRAAINVLRGRQGLAPFPFTDPILNVATAQIRAIHVAEMRSALDAVFDALGAARPRYTDQVIDAGTTIVKAIHFAELRNAIKAADVPESLLNGTWRGQTQFGSPFAMWVNGGSVIGIDTMITGSGSGPCGQIFLKGDVVALITNNSFTLFPFGAVPVGVNAVLVGTFSGSTSAAGTIDVAWAPIFGCAPVHVAWSATHTDPGPVPVITVAASDPEASEVGGNDGAFTISRTGSLGEDVSVQFGVTGTASAGEDYTYITSATIPAGQSAVTVTVHPLQDALVEPSETVILTLFDAAPYILGTSASATVNITD